MRDIDLYGKARDIKSVLEWIDANWEESSCLNCTHFYFDDGDTYFTASLWMQGMKSVRDWSDFFTEDKFEDAGNGWIIRRPESWGWNAYKNGKLFYIS